MTYAVENAVVRGLRGKGERARDVPAGKMICPVRRVVFTKTLVGFFALSGIAVAGGCSTTTTVQQSNPGTEAGADGGTESPDEDDPANQPPHALATITLGEMHASGTGSPTPIVSASFVPDALLAKSCTKKLGDSCEIRELAKCSKDDTPGTGCAQGEACVLDDDCTSVCKKIPVCEERCAKDEICALPKGSSTGKASCVKSESFDGGPLAFSGTTTAITLYPPYEYESDGRGAPFLAGAEIQVQAAGATEAGFEKFDEKFTATTFLQTSPALSKIPREKIFSEGAIPLAWVPGNDTIVVTVSGTGGSATCKVPDAPGKFELPRSVVKAAQGDSKTSSSSSISISVARQKKDVKKDKKTKGTLATGTVQPVGWVELVTLSSESASFQGCPSGQAICGDDCVDVLADEQNCGSCGKTCKTGESCDEGACTSDADTCNKCLETAAAGACNATRTACLNDTACTSFASCYEACTTTACQSNCQTMHAAGVTKYNAFISCMNTQCGAICE